jgi:1-acyl-sn-glycerol-3-phosphate acyltransferase
MMILFNQHGGPIQKKSYSDFSNENSKSLEERVEKPHILRLNRNPIYFSIGKMLAWSFVKSRSYKHYEIPEETIQLMRDQKKHKNFAIYYVATHKSLWETLAIPYAISWHGGDIPFVMMGNNLLEPGDSWKERLLFGLVTHSGVVPMERRRSAVQIMIDDITKIVSANRNLLIFSEGTRSRDGLIQPFKPAGFEGMARAVSGGADVYIVPVNVDYSNMIELPTFAGENELTKLKVLMLSEPFQYLTAANKISSLRDIYHYTNFISEAAYAKVEEMVTSGKTDYKTQWKELLSAGKFNVNDSRNWKIFIDDVYLSFGKPVHVCPNDSHDYRGELARDSLELCKDLVKIQKVNVLSESIVRMNPTFGLNIYSPELYPYIEEVLADLKPHENKFRNLNLHDKPADIIIGAKMEIDSRHIEEYKIISNQINHYLPKK